MQLTPAPARTALAQRLRTAACLLVASGAPLVAHAQVTPTTQFEVSALGYAEASRTNVVEPMARLTRTFANGQSLSALLGIDVITGASPTGGVPTGRTETTTSASGTATTNPADHLPTTKFQDARGVLDLEWTRPLGALAATTAGTHFSREKDYQSVGWSGKLTVDVLQRLSTLTLAGSVDADEVMPVGGVVKPFRTDRIRDVDHASRRSSTGLVGLSRVLTRRWMVAANFSGTRDRGDLTDPYKVVSFVKADSGTTDGQLTERRPGVRDRRDVLASSVYHLADDVFYSSYRYYWDTWKLRSHTVDLSYRHELPDDAFLQPHVRFYTQSPAEFYTYDFVRGSPLPDYASSDFRLGPLRTLTLGATYGFKVADYPGEFRVRAEYLRQWGDGHPATAVGIQKTFSLFPSVDIGSLVASWSVEF